MKLDGKDKLSTISLLQYLHGIVMFIFIFFLNNFISARFMGQHTERQYQLKNQGEQNKSSSLQVLLPLIWQFSYTCAFVKVKLYWVLGTSNFSAKPF